MFRGVSSRYLRLLRLGVRFRELGAVFVSCSLRCRVCSEVSVVLGSCVVGRLMDSCDHVLVG